VGIAHHLAPNDPMINVKFQMRNDEMKGGGLMLWIMASPEGAIQTTDKQRNKINVRIEEAIHGKDHPGNQ
jgi:hypothetical protein